MNAMNNDTWAQKLINHDYREKNDINRPSQLYLFKLKKLPPWDSNPRPQD